MEEGPAKRGQTLVDVALAALRRDLNEGVLAPGARIGLGETAAALGMSPIPVREALRTLASEGLVIALPQRGYRVPASTLEDLEDLYRLRLLLDPLATELAVPNLTDADLTAAEDALERLHAALVAGDWHAVRVANREFHFVLYAGSRSPWLVKLVSMLWDASERYQLDAGPGRGTPKQRREEHARILRACRARKAAAAAELMHAHLRRTLELARLSLTRVADGNVPAPARLQ